MATKIEWVKNADGSQGKTWNIVSGCTKVSEGCKNCYAERMWIRLSANNMPYEGRAFTDVQMHSERMEQPLRWKKPQTVFVCSMSDLFHELVPDTFIMAVFAIIVMAPQHTFIVLTKRPERMRDFCNKFYSKNCPIPTNVRLGVSIEDQITANERIPPLLDIPGANRFLSIEPLLGPIDFFECSNAWFEEGYKPWMDAQLLTGIGWVIVGGESGHKARAMKERWATSIRHQCQFTNTPFFFKQGSQANWKRFKDFNSFPVELQVREYPDA